MPGTKKKFGGALAKPIILPPRPRHPVIAAGEEAEKKYKRELAEYESHSASKAVAHGLSKMMVLLQHYGIDEKDADPWFKLSVCLARDFVPGFSAKTPKPPGKKIVWYDGTLALLYRVVTDRLAQKKSNGSTPNKKQLFSELVKEEPWKGLGLIKGSNEDAHAKALQNRYSEACKSPLVKWLLQMEADPRTAKIMPGLWAAVTGSTTK